MNPLLESSTATPAKELADVHIMHESAEIYSTHFIYPVALLIRDCASEAVCSGSLRKSSDAVKERVSIATGLIVRWLSCW